MDVYVLSSKNGVTGVYSTLNAAKNSVEMMVWSSLEDNRVFEGREEWADKKATYTINRMRLK